MNQKNAVSAQKVSRQGGQMKMRRREKRNDLKLLLTPCLCDLLEIRDWTHAADASTAGKSVG